MGRHCRGCLQVERVGRTLHPRRQHHRILLPVKRTRHIDDRGACLRRRLPVFAGQLGTAAEEREVGMRERGRRNRLDKRHLVADRLQLTDRLLIVHQDKIGFSKW